jgi:chromosome segregation ATPase
MILTFILIFLLGLSIGAEYMRRKYKKEGKIGSSSNNTHSAPLSKNTNPTAQQTEVKNLDTQIKDMRAEKQSLEIEIKNLKNTKEESKKELQEANSETVRAKNILEALNKEVGQIEYDKKRNKNLSIELASGIKNFEAVVAQSGLSQVPSIQKKAIQTQSNITAQKVELSKNGTLPNELLRNPYNEPLPDIEELPEKYEKSTKPKPKTD